MQGTPGTWRGRVRHGCGGGRVQGLCGRPGPLLTAVIRATQAAVFWDFHSAAVRQNNEDQEEKA